MSALVPRNVALALVAVSAVASAQRPQSRQDLPVAVAHGNVASAGVMRGGVLSLALVAQPTRWHPEASDGPSVDVEAFAEEGKAPSIPGPLVRARMGTRINATVRNALPDTLLVFGLTGTAADTIRIAPGETERASFTAGAAGTYAYGGATIVRDSLHLLGTGNQLLGALVVDGASPQPDRVFVLSIWPPLPGRFVMAINGKSWPHTERLDVVVGDSVRWRVVNGTRGRHPMHLHGFYFRIDSRGSWFADSAMKGARPLVVTESVPYRGTFTMTWAAERPGNWLFHCHDALHTTWRRRYNLIGERPPATPPMHDAAHHVEQDMSGLVLAIRARTTRKSLEVAPRAPSRRLRIVATERPAVYRAEPGFSYIATNGAEPARDSLVIPARPLILTRGQPTSITVVNRLSIATAVHWHGIELESYYDGVAGWSGDSVRRAPLIAPNDSFMVHMTPPRAGTFIFHAHADDMRQIALGLYGPLIVLPPRQRWDTARDHVFLVSQLGRGPGTLLGVNGNTGTSTMTLAAGVRHRLRLINISIEHDAVFTLVGGAATLRWRAVAKDGADLHAQHSIVQPAVVQIAPGETYDYELTLPAGEYRLHMRSRNDVDVRIIVR